MVDLTYLQPNSLYQQLRRYLPVMTNYPFHNRTYRYCNGNIFFDIAANYMNLDPSFISESVTRIGVGAFMEIPDYYACVNYYTKTTDMDILDYYQGGICAGKIVKLLFDININNWAYPS